MAVIGGGLVGITTAALLRRAGLSAALLEAGRILQGVTGRTTTEITAATSPSPRPVCC